MSRFWKSVLVDFRLKKHGIKPGSFWIRGDEEDPFEKNRKMNDMYYHYRVLSIKGRHVEYESVQTGRRESSEVGSFIYAFYESTYDEYIYERYK